MKTLNIFLTNCAMCNGNRGCVALSISAMYIIDKILSRHNVPYRFYLPNSGHKRSGEYAIELGGKKIEYTAITEYRNDGIKNKIKNIAKYRRYRKSVNLYSNADYVLDIGQGDSFSDIYGLHRFDSIYRAHSKTIKHRTKFCLLPQTVGPFQTPEIRDLAIRSIGYASLVFTRDKQSRDYAQRLVPDKEIFESIDVAFCLPYDKIEQPKDNIHVGLNISALLWNGGYSQNNQFGLKAGYKDVIDAVIEKFLSIPDVKLHLIPHVVEGERGIENDYAVAYDIYRSRKNDNLILAPFFLDPIAAKSYIAGMDFFMGARMHSTIAAFSSGVPVVPMAYSRKFNGLFLDTLDYSPMVDLKERSLDESLDIITEAFEQRDSLKGIIADRMKGVVGQRLDLMEQKLEAFFGL